MEPWEGWHRATRTFITTLFVNRKVLGNVVWGPNAENYDGVYTSINNFENGVVEKGYPGEFISGGSP